MSGTVSSPKGNLRVVSTDLKPNQRHAVYLTVTFEDESGKRWSLDASAFRFDLEFVPPDRSDKT